MLCKLVCLRRKVNKKDMTRIIVENILLKCRSEAFGEPRSGSPSPRGGRKNGPNKAVIASTEYLGKVLRLFWIKFIF